LNYRVPSSADYKDKSKKGPTNFTTCEFDEQDILIARVSDTQKDYTGRYGNYLIHGLLIPKNQLLFAPTHGMNWKGWKTNLLPEDDQKTPKHLPKLSIDEITNGIPVTDLRRKGANLALDWAKKDPARADGIASAIAYLAVTNDKNGQIVIQDTVDEAFNWAHTFLSLLPYPCYSSFDWSTYAYSPVGVKLQMLPPGPFETEWINYLYSDHVASIKQEDLGNAESLLLDKIEADRAEQFHVMKQNYRQLLDSHATTVIRRAIAMPKNFKVTQLDDSLAEIIYCQKLLERKNASAALTSSELMMVFELFEEHLKTEAVETAFETILDLIQKVEIDEKDELFWPRASVFAATMAKKTGDEDVSHQAADMLTEYFSSQGFTSHGKLKSSLKAFDQLSEKLPELRQGLDYSIIDIAAENHNQIKQLGSKSAQLIILQIGKFSLKNRNRVEISTQVSTLLGRLMPIACLDENVFGDSLLKYFGPAGTAIFYAEESLRSHEPDFIDVSEDFYALQASLDEEQKSEFYTSWNDIDAGNSFWAYWFYCLNPEYGIGASFDEFEHTIGFLPEFTRDKIYRTAGNQLDLLLSRDNFENIALDWYKSDRKEYLSAKGRQIAAEQIINSLSLKKLFRDPNLLDSLIRDIGNGLAETKALSVKNINICRQNLTLEKLQHTLSPIASLNSEDQKFALREIIKLQLLANARLTQHQKLHNAITSVFLYTPVLDKKFIIRTYTDSLMLLTKKHPRRGFIDSAILYYLKNPQEVAGSWFFDAIILCITERISLRQSKDLFNNLEGYIRKHQSESYDQFVQFRKFAEKNQKGVLSRITGKLFK